MGTAIFEQKLTFKESIGSKIKDFFASGKEVYKGYVDDPRNTDNAWMETVAYLIHDNEGIHLLLSLKF